MFVTQFEWVIQAPHLIYQINTWNFQNYPIFVIQFEWVIQLPNLIYQVKSPHH
jgi:hypothetical protein